MTLSNVAMLSSGGVTALLLDSVSVQG